MYVKGTWHSGVVYSRIAPFSDFLNEDKERIINKLAYLSSEEKKILIDFFRAYPHLEGKEGGINWQDKGLLFSDFHDVLQKVSKTAKKKAVKLHGIAGLKEGTDYIELVINSDEYSAYIPLSWEASKLIASSKIGGVNGKWCTAWQKSSSHWDFHVYTKKQFPIYIIGYKNKWALMVEEDNKSYVIWDIEDNGSKINIIPNLEVSKDIILYSNNQSIIKKTRKDHFFRRFIESAQTKDAKFEYDEKGNAIWHSGTWQFGKWINGIWESGSWDDGVWEDGTWYMGIWRGGIWNNGIWNGGEWRGGRWRGGTWNKGYWKDGYWYDGNWQEGEWRDGEWLKGQWHDGIWHNGVWHNGVWQAGNWNNGTWYDGIWKNGLWKAGTWKAGSWLAGDWHDGTWESGLWGNGNWFKGTWENGTWMGGTWYGGVWKGGKWMGGKDKNGKFHGENDSPNKWKI